MISVIIPAHNEENVIAASLHALTPGIEDGTVEVIVVCNGCTDRTVDVVLSFGKHITCIQTAVPSKSNALNLGDAQASGFPRIYLDADIILTIDAIRQLANVLQSAKYLAAAPTMRMDFSSASRLVRCYYEIWQQLPYVVEGMIGAGVYALSEKGRKRFEIFPDIIADDGYIRALFNSGERTIVKSCYSVVKAPANISSLIKIKTRSRLGRFELSDKYPNLLKNERKNYTGAVILALRQIHLWPQYTVYLFVNLVSRIRATIQVRAQGFIGWERDESSRQNKA